MPVCGPLGRLWPRLRCGPALGLALSSPWGRLRGLGGLVVMGHADKAGWMGEARAVPVAEVVAALDLAPGKGGKGWKPCPACSATTRGSTDERGPLGLRADGRGWECYPCGAKGDGVALVAHALGLGERPTSWAPVAAWFRERGWIEDRRPTSSSSTRPAARPVVAPRPAPAPAVSARLDRAEVLALWDGCTSVEASAVAPWFDVRARAWGLDGAAARRVVEGLDLARCCARVGLDLPAWACIGRTSWADGWPLVLPCYDADGELVALRARRTAYRRTVEGLDELRGPLRWSSRRGEWVSAEWLPVAKEVSPSGSGACRGAVYADPLARAVLAAGGRARRGDALLADAPGLRWSGRVLVVEGGPAFLRFAADLRRVRVLDDHAEAPAVVGLWSGAWPDDEVGDELAARFAGAVVALAPDRDENGAGERTAEKVGRCLSRAGVTWKPWTWWGTDART